MSFSNTYQSVLGPDESMYKKIADCLNVASEYTVSVGVRIAVEPHDNFARSTTVSPALDQSHPDLHMIWDIRNTFAAGEDPAEGFEFLKNRLVNVHVKDGTRYEPVLAMCMIGDRLYTDIAVGERAWIPTTLVLSGETRQGYIALSPYRPTYMFQNLGAVADSLLNSQK